MAESAGIMSAAFFVGKTELLRWLNDFFQIGYTKVEECATGAIYCQIMDSIYPGKVPLGKVNFNCKNAVEFTPNYKVLQAVFDGQNIKKHIDVEKLCKAKYQDNLEFLQWIKHFWDSKYNGEPYDAVARREQAIQTYSKGRKFAGPAPSIAKPKPAAESKVPAAAPSAVARPKPAAAAAPKPAAAAAKAPAAASSADTDGKVQELNTRLTKLKLTIEGLEKERNFYFGKLREIEVLCQAKEDDDPAAGFKDKVLEILYATDGNEEFEAPAEDAAPVDEAVGDDAELVEAPGDDEQTF